MCAPGCHRPGRAGGGCRGWRRSQDNPQRAVRLLAAARSILDARGSGWLHAFVPRVSHDDAALAALRSRIGDAAFDQAQVGGRSADSKRAVEYALQEA
jgi:hypothetical protein